MATVHLGPTAWPYAIAYDSVTGDLYVAGFNPNGGSGANLTVIRGTTGAIVANVSTGAALGVAYDSGKREAFVTGSDNVSVVSDATHAVVATISLATGSSPVGIAYDAGTGEVFVADFGTGFVDVIADSNNTVVASISLGMTSRPWAVAYDAATSEVYVTDYGLGQVDVISDAMNTVTARITVGSTPLGVTVDSARSEVFVANNGSSSVSVISDSTHMVAATIMVGPNPTAIAYGPGTGEVAVTYVYSIPPYAFGRLGLIADSNNTIVATVNLFGGSAADVPGALAYDPANHGWYLADGAAGAVEVVAASYYVTFTESGLPMGTMWQMWLNGTTPYGPSRTSTASSLTTLRFTASNGTYTFTVVPVAGYAASPASGPVTVAGADVGKAIAFSYVYTATFSETGLPSGTTWSVTFAGNAKSASIPYINFTAVNGTYAFTVGDVAGYVASPASGNVVFNGSEESRAITFTPAPPPSTLPVTAILAGVAAAVVVAALLGFLLMRRRRKAAPASPPPTPEGPGGPPPAEPPR